MLTHSVSTGRPRKVYWRQRLDRTPCARLPHAELHFIQYVIPSVHSSIWWSFSETDPNNPETSWNILIILPKQSNIW